MYRIGVIIFFIMFFGQLYAQENTVYTSDLAIYNKALELFDKEKYSAAQEQFKVVLNESINNNSEVKASASYYHALCGLFLFNEDAESLLNDFIHNYPESSKVKQAYFHLGRYKFRKKKYIEVIKWFDKIDIYELSNSELSEYYFKKGYSYFMEEDYTEATKSFFEIKDIDTKYTAPARYYYGHIKYLQGSYETALQTFLLLQTNPKFGPIVPYYITQIYYLQKKYDKIIEYAPALLDTAIPKRAPEIARIIGDAYYVKKDYKHAIPYLLRYNKSAGLDVKREEQYQLGYAYYKVDSCDKAIKWLKKSIDKEDSLTQVAHYHLAECYMGINKKNAKSSLRIASKLSFDNDIKEDALFNYAKLSYELSLHPYNDAIKAFEEYIASYPNSKKIASAYEYLVAVYFTTENYKMALESIEKIDNMNNKLQEAYQKITHYRGIELFNNHNYKNAIVHFIKAEKYVVDELLNTKNTYWKAESYYRLQEYEKSIANYKQINIQSAAFQTPYIQNVGYHLGYAYFKLKEYENAKLWLRKYLQSSDNLSAKNQHDALNRVGDCFFITKDYIAAIEYYDKAALVGKYQLDYSLYQSAVANGVVGRYNEKINLLKTLVSKSDKSHLLDDAHYELGVTYLLKNKELLALEQFEKIINDYSNSNYISKALLKKGLIHYNKKEDEKALLAFKRVVKEYKGTEEEKESLAKIKSIYKDAGNLSTYENYLASIGSNDSSLMVLDADYYEVAENTYISGNCEKAVKEFAKYLEKYPNGTYVLNAHYYKADCENRSGFTNEALLDYNYVIDKQKNKFTEHALLAAAKINTELKQYKQAIKNYNQLEYLADIQSNVFKAQVEQMRLHFRVNNYTDAIKYCELIVNKDDNDAKLITETHLINAKSHMALDNYNKAYDEFKIASSAFNQYGAEAKYNIAFITYLRGEHDKCESEIFSLIKVYGAYDFWIGKALILLSDNYLAKKDVFQAKVTLKNILDNAKNEQIISIAKQKLESIENQEKQERKINEQEDININLIDEESIDINKLYDEEIFKEEPLPIINDSLPKPDENK